MVVIEPGQATSEVLWRATVIAVLIDVPLLIIVARWVSSELFSQLKWYLVGAAFIIYAAIWGTFGSYLYWDAVYKAIFPIWFRWWLPLVYGLLFGVLALASWRVSSLVVRWQAIWFCLLGGMFSLVGHSIGMSRGLLRVPLLAEVSPASALVFGVFEFIFYWCAIIGLSLTIRWLRPWLKLTERK